MNLRLKFALATFCFFTVVSCNDKKSDTLFELVKNSGIDFTNRVDDSKDFNIFSYRNFYNGGGVAIGDINNDSLPDVFFTANMGPNKLYLNKGGFKFEDISEKAGFGEKQKWSTGVVMVDLNADGWLDIYVCNAGYQKGVGQENELFINNKNGTFTEKAKDYGLDDPSFTTHAAFFDYDLDGDLDCYLLNNSFIPVNTLNYSNKRNLRAKDWPVEEFIKGGGDKLLRNDNGRFTDVSEAAGIYGSLIGFGLGVTVGDINGDHYPDLYISNDFFERDYLYINQKDGTFSEELEHRMQHISLSSMGADMADINNDDYPDIFVTDMYPADDYRLKTTSSYDNVEIHTQKVREGFYHQYMQNTMQVNNQSGAFMETAHLSGVAGSDWSWGGLIFDADNDGLSDLYVCNGIYHDVTDQDFIDFFADEIIQRMVMTGEKKEVSEVINKMPSTPILNKFYHNKGNLQFSDAGELKGFTQKSFSNGAAYADLDNDGDLDLVVNNVNEKAFVYRNHSNSQLKNNYIAVQLKGKEQNTFAIGSKIKLYAGSEIISREVIPSRGFQSSCDYRQTIGFGNKKIDSLLIIWPDLSQTVIKQPGINQLHVVKQTAKEVKLNESSIETQPLFVKNDSTFERHKENEFVDFYYERNIPVKLSAQGPRAAVGDVNNDGLDDVYICGAMGQAGQLYLQTKSGFKKKEQSLFEEMKLYEDVTALMKDVDGDKDLDLIVGSGGHTQPSQKAEIRNRLYRNDGKGNFTYDKDALPPNADNTGVIIANDIDSDGDLDLFVGGRSKSYNYGVSPQSMILINDGKGIFSDATVQFNAAIKTIGMVTGAVFTDVNADQQKELIIVGEWMAPRIFTYRNKKYEELPSSLNQLSGWWQTITAADLDGDGDEDLVLGNYGNNFYLQADSSNPVKMFINDFDGNGIPEKIITKSIEQKDKPVFLKREMQEQIPSLKKQNLKHADFATKTIQELFAADILEKCVLKQVNYSSSCIAWNEGNAKFSIQPLPLLTQLSSMNAVVAKDINNDGKPDLILAGNEFDFIPQFGRLDASYGTVLLNKGNRQWQTLMQKQSGIFVRGMVRDIQWISTPNGKAVLFLQNNEAPVLYRLNQ
jgi:enediyne biosynthesis protein E4